MSKDLEKRIEELKDLLRKIESIERGTGWSPDKIIIDRFGLNKEDIDRYNLMWIDNLRTSSGRESHDYGYIQKYGRRKCESNALFKNDETLKAGEEICRKAIEKYYGQDAKERFRRKEEDSKEKLSQVYDDPIWEKFYKRINELVESLTVKKPKEGKQLSVPTAEKEVEVTIDNKYYGKCPRCGRSFDYDYTSDVGRLVRCRHCNLPMRLRGVSPPQKDCSTEEERKWINEQYERLEKLSDEELRKIASSPPTWEQHLGYTIQNMAEDVLFARATANSKPENAKLQDQHPARGERNT